YFQVIPGHIAFYEVILVEGKGHSANHSQNSIYWLWTTTSKSSKLKLRGEGISYKNTAFTNQIDAGRRTSRSDAGKRSIIQYYF
ncbi:MAG: hypothetical protein WCF85_11955, partial [Rhodospirillaceae bacterium]